ncbi:MAG: hypothetical protein Fur005_08440 [Roseiflexaceae bacterium]
MRRLRSCLLQLAITIGSASLIGVAWLGIMLWDPFHRWQPLPPSPVAIASIVDIRHTIITIRAADEQLYTIDPDRDQAWMLITSLPTGEEASVAQIVSGPCALPGIEMCQPIHRHVSKGKHSISMVVRH